MLLKTLMAAAVAVPLSLMSANAAIITLETEATSVEVGETFDVSAIFTAESLGDFLTGFQLGLIFDDEAFDVLSADFVDPNTGVNQLSLPNPEFDETFLFDSFADLALAIGLSGNSDQRLMDGQANRFAFVTFTFLATAVTASGDIGIDVVSSFLGGAFSDLDPTIGQDISVEVVPLPGAALFFLTGLGAAAARRRLA